MEDVQLQDSSKVRPKVYFIVFLLTILLAGSVDYFAVYASDLYVTAKRFIRTDPELHKQLGDIVDITLPFRKYSYSYGGNSGRAFMYLDVTTNSGLRRVYVELKKSEGEWQVTKYRTLTSSEHGGVQ